MTAHATLTARNADYVSRHAGPAGFVPPLQTVVLCCADHRADPAHVLGLEPNEAVVIRNPGGRITRAFLEQMLALGTIAQREGRGELYELVVMHHTGCGLTTLSPTEDADLLAMLFGIEPDEVASRRSTDPWAAVAVDVALLRANPFVPRSMVVSGLVCDIDTGAVHTVVPPAPLGAEADTESR